MLARAFAGDPAMTYLFPDRATRPARLSRLMRLLYDSDGRGGMRLVTGAAEAATLWRGPTAANVGWGEVIASLWPLLATFGPALPRALRLSRTIEAHFPPQPFWYLHVAGVEPALQRRGLGSAAIRAGLTRATADGMPAYLETATERNVRLYRSLGFEVTGEWQMPGNGPHFWSLMKSA